MARTRTMRMVAALVLWISAVALAQLQKGDYVAVCGDSITEQKQYSVLIEDYLLMCRPAADLRVTQFGWGGETSWGFLWKMPTQALKFDMTVATTCYGMNDGGYSPMTPDKGKNYYNAMTGIVKKFKEKGVRFIVVGSPGIVDMDTFRKGQPGAGDAYNKTLGELRDIAKQVAQEQGVAFANVHDTMLAAAVKAKERYGKDYHVGGGDGVHPDRNGQLLMAYAFLKAMGCDGNIGTITVDLASGSATATDGHKVLSSAAGTAEIESTRYPFCFYGDPKSTSATSGMIEFCDFNKDLNRFMLVVKGANGDVKVTWGKTSKQFPAAAAAAGINLAAEFLDNPFSEPFLEVEKTIRAQQDYETPLVKTLLNGLGEMKRIVPEESDSIDRIAMKAIAKDYQMQAASAAAVKPVKHVIKVEVVK